jgi:hypothetical protein
MSVNTNKVSAVATAEWRRKLLQAELILIKEGCRGAASDIAGVIGEIAELMRAVASYQGECESPCPCHVMKQQHRREMFVAAARLQGGEK